MISSSSSPSAVCSGRRMQRKVERRGNARCLRRVLNKWCLSTGTYAYTCISIHKCIYLHFELKTLHIIKDIHASKHTNCRHVQMYIMSDLHTREIKTDAYIDICIPFPFLSPSLSCFLSLPFRIYEFFAKAVDSPRGNLSRDNYRESVQPLWRGPRAIWENFFDSESFSRC